MSMFDIIVIAVVGILTIIGWWKGMIRQVFGLAGIIAGYVLAMKFSQPCAKLLTDFRPDTAKVAAFIAIFLACILVASLIGWAVGRLVANSTLGFFNRVGGGILGFLKGYVVICIVVVVLTVFLSADNSLFRRSSTVKYVLPGVSMLKKVARGETRTRYNEKIGKEKPAGSGKR